MDCPLFFSYTSEFRVLSKQVPDTATHVVIELSKTPYIDQSGLFTLVEVFQELRQAGVEILLVGVNQKPLIRMQEVDIVPDLVREAHIFENFHDCVEFIEQNVEDVV